MIWSVWLVHKSTNYSKMTKKCTILSYGPLTIKEP